LALNKPLNRGPRLPFKKKEAEHNINQFIRATEIRLVGDNVEPGVYSLRDALALADEQELDLVEISPNAVPPVCKITDYNKFIYEQKKKLKEIKSNAKQTVIKEIRFGPNTDDHDFDFKLIAQYAYPIDGVSMFIIQMHGTSHTRIETVDGS
jgi:translation initiation factor IF-3